jgi:hypothetical protein
MHSHSCCDRNIYILAIDVITQKNAIMPMYSVTVNSRISRSSSFLMIVLEYSCESFALFRLVLFAHGKATVTTMITAIYLNLEGEKGTISISDQPFLSM